MIFKETEKAYSISRFNIRIWVRKADVEVYGKLEDGRTDMEIPEKYLDEKGYFKKERYPSSGRQFKGVGLSTKWMPGGEK